MKNLPLTKYMANLLISILANCVGSFGLIPKQVNNMSTAEGIPAICPARELLFDCFDPWDDCCAWPVDPEALPEGVGVEEADEDPEGTTKGEALAIWACIFACFCCCAARNSSFL